MISNLGDYVAQTNKQTNKHTDRQTKQYIYIVDIIGLTVKKVRENALLF